MRTRKQTLIVTACVLALAGCTSAEPTTEDPTTPPAASAPSTPSAPAAPPTSAAPAVPTDLPSKTMLPAAALPGAQGPRDDTEGVVDWRVPPACGAGAPPGAAAMRTVSQGTVELEGTLGVQQVAVFADADAAVAEADRLTAALTACTGYASDSTTTYVLEPLDVGAQGVGFATDYYGASAQGQLDGAIGAYLAATRRGTAVTLVSAEGGESQVGAARETITGAAQSAWDLLCAYDSAGC